MPRASTVRYYLITHCDKVPGERSYSVVPCMSFLPRCQNGWRSLCSLRELTGPAEEVWVRSDVVILKGICTTISKGVVE